MNAEFFIQHKYPHNSRIAFYVDGESWLRDPINPAEGIIQIKKLANYSLLLLYQAERMAWPKGVKHPENLYLLEEEWK